MTPEERIQKLGEELQVLAFNLAEKLDTLNFHSGREAVRALRDDGVYDMVDEMQQRIRSLIHNLHNVGRDAAVEGPRGMDALLDIVRKCTGEPDNYRYLIDNLIPLIRELDEWGDHGPLPADGP